MIIRRYRRSLLWKPGEELLKKRIMSEIAPTVEDVKTEVCFYIDLTRPLREIEATLVEWLLAETFEPGSLTRDSSLQGTVLEVGPRVEITTPWSTNAVKICHSCGLTSVRRLERSRRYQIDPGPGTALNKEQITHVLSLLYDRMTESPYLEPLTTFESDRRPAPVKVIPLLEEGLRALEKLDLALDRQLVEHNYHYFAKVLGTNPTDVLLTHLDQTQSDHSRHRRFNAIWRLDGTEKELTLMNMIKANHVRHPGHTLVAFEDNASVIRGHKVPMLLNSDPAGPSAIVVQQTDADVTAKGESHNHPTAIVSFAGAATGTGGRIRDNQTVGRGGSVVAGSTLYLVGNLSIPGYDLPWETRNWKQPYQLETPLQIILGAPKGAYRYGNEFGEPVLSGSTTSFEYVHESGKQSELFGYTKCGMWAVGVGWVNRNHVKKGKPEVGHAIVQLGGDAYRIGLGGASGSSRIAGAQEAELDWNSVQRANAEMEKVVDRVIQACIMMGSRNPIRSIHDLGAGGDANAISELVSPAGCRVFLRRIPCGDSSLSVLELWCNESQERVALLVEQGDVALLQDIAGREKCPVAVIGEITGDGRLVLVDEHAPANAPVHEKEPVNLDLGFALGKIPQLAIDDKSARRSLAALELPEGLTVLEALKRVLRLLKVASKEFLVNHVDRSVTGLVAQQQCSGPLQLPVADVAVTADSYLATTGRCWAIGDQPVKWIVNPESSVRLAVCESLTNLAWALVEDFEGISLLGNWGVAASEPGEGACLYRANEALASMLDTLGISINGGKDSMSMAARVTRENVGGAVKAPGTLVVTAYAACPDITGTVTPDIKEPGKSRLMLIDLSRGKCRMGGTALAQVFEQIGDEAPDIDDPKLLRKCFEAVQELIKRRLVLAGHDRSDGGLAVCLLEMAFAGDCGLDIQLSDPSTADKNPLHILFAEEPGMVIEYSANDEEAILETLQKHGVGVCCQVIGSTSSDKQIRLQHMGKLVLSEDMRVLRNAWQETSFELEKLQTTPECAKADNERANARSGLRFELTFTPSMTPRKNLEAQRKPKVAILREEGTNGDREMGAAFFLAGFEPWDVTMTDLAEGRIGLESFRGVAFCGGFAYADVLDAGKGWAGVIRFDKRIRQEFESFFARSDSFSLGVCNGCQLMALLGWVPWQGMEARLHPRFVCNESGMFESRFVAVRVMTSPSIFLKDMAGSVLGVWVAHGEGRFFCPDQAAVKEIEHRNLAPIRFADDSGMITEKYPSNPNGSPLGIAALCSPDGRHLAVMPHPERVFLRWQWPYWPREWRNMETSPWLKLFQNAREWCRQIATTC
jgi:phosphoribosylformylglycinamidine synthase